MSSFDLSVPWRPRLDGALVPILKILAEFVRNKTEPSPNDDPGWVPSALSLLLEDSAPVKSALIESLTAIWRLKQVEDEGIYDDIWVKHVAAWMVSLELVLERSQFNINDVS
jgi:hypothetical protein